MPELATAAEAPLLNPIERLANVFIAPVKTFEDVRRSSGWWVPYLVAVAIGVLYGFALLHKIGLPALIDGVIRQSPALESRISSSTPEVAAQIQVGIGRNFKFLSYAGPVFSLLAGPCRPRRS